MNRTLADLLTGAATLAVLALLSAAPAQTNIDPNATGNQYGWSEAVGWANLKSNPQDAFGVRVLEAGLTGFAWFEGAGWVNFGSGAPPYAQTGPADFGVNRDGDGNLSGFAWSESLGWINFDTLPVGARVTIAPADGTFSGFAWSEAAGWLCFETVPAAHVAQGPAFEPPLELAGVVVR